MIMRREFMIAASLTALAASAGFPRAWAADKAAIPVMLYKAPAVNAAMGTPPLLANTVSR